MSDEATVIDTPAGIEFVRLCSLRGRLNLEVAGLRFKGPSLGPILARDFGITARTKKGQLEAVDKIIEERLAEAQLGIARR